MGPGLDGRSIRVHLGGMILAIPLALAACSAHAGAQAPPPASAASNDPATLTQAPPVGLANAQSTLSAAPATPSGTDLTVPAGTKVLLAVQSPVNTKTAKPGDGVYLVSTFPVIVGSHVLIPAGVYVQGVIDQVERPGRVKGRAKLLMHFTTMIFPNGQVVSVPGGVNNLPGSDNCQGRCGRSRHWRYRRSSRRQSAGRHRIRWRGRGGRGSDLHPVHPRQRHYDYAGTECRNDHAAASRPATRAAGRHQ
jgi:hypothetical protein